MLFMSAFGLSEHLERGTADDRASATQVRGRSLREYGQASTPKKTRGAARVLLVLGPMGLGLVAFGLWRMRHQAKLLDEGVAVVGHLTKVVMGVEHPYLAYRFEDDAGVVHQGILRLATDWLMEEYLVGQEVTVVYDPENPRKNLLDIDGLRRADVRERRW
jgi:hypothetical protein